MTKRKENEKTFLHGDAKKQPAERVALRFYLKYINPLVALLVFILCTYSSMKGGDEEPLVVLGPLAGSVGTYFFAKGLFCSVALFLLGKTVEIMISIQKNNLPK